MVDQNGRPRHLPTQSDRARLRDLVSAFELFEDEVAPTGEITTPAFDKLVESANNALFGSRENEAPSPTLYAALRALLGYLVGLSFDYHGDHAKVSSLAQSARDTPEQRENQEMRAPHLRLMRVEALAEALAVLLENRFGENTHFGLPIDFEAISQLSRAFWSARRQRMQRRRTRHPMHPVLRINDIPFAEAVFPEMMSTYSSEMGKSVEVVRDIDWSEVGSALFTNRIDVAIYNGSIVKRIEEVRGSFEHRLVCCSEPLFRYQKYVILQNDFVVEDERGQAFGVPWKSDFEEVIKARLTTLSNRTARVEGIEYEAGAQRKAGTPLEVTLHYCDSADQALQRLVDGQLAYCIVGGLQACYGEFRFGADRHGKKRVRRLGSLDLPLSQLGNSQVRFWVAVDRYNKAEAAISAMAAIWNNHVVRRWNRIVNSISPDIDVYADTFVELINSYPHLSFVRDFEGLAELIRVHDTELSAINPKVTPIKFGV